MALFDIGRLSVSSHVDVATENLLDLEDSVIVMGESNRNMGEDQLDNRQPSETNNNPALVRSSPSPLALARCYADLTMKLLQMILFKFKVLFFFFLSQVVPPGPIKS